MTPGAWLLYLRYTWAHIILFNASLRAHASWTDEWCAHLRYHAPWQMRHHWWCFYWGCRHLRFAWHAKHSTRADGFFPSTLMPPNTAARSSISAAYFTHYWRSRRFDARHRLHLSPCWQQPNEIERLAGGIIVAARSVGNVDAFYHLWMIILTLLIELYTHVMQLTLAIYLFISSPTLKDGISYKSGTYAIFLEQRRHGAPQYQLRRPPKQVYLLYLS